MARLRRQMAGLPTSSTLKTLEPLHRRKLPVLQELSFPSPVVQESFTRVQIACPVVCCSI